MPCRSTQEKFTIPPTDQHRHKFKSRAGTLRRPPRGHGGCCNLARPPRSHERCCDLTRPLQGHGGYRDLEWTPWPRRKQRNMLFYFFSFFMFLFLFPIFFSLSLSYFFPPFPFFMLNIFLPHR